LVQSLLAEWQRLGQNPSIANFRESRVVSNADDDFLVLHEIVKAAKKNLSPEVWDYLVGGAETETTLKRNRQAIDSLAFRPRVLRDVSDVDCSTTLFGEKLRIPVFLAPIGSLQDLEPGGGASAARAAGRFGTATMLSSRSEPALEVVAECSDGPKIFQLYVRGDRRWLDDHIRRALDAGYYALCLTVDLDHYGRRERDLAKRHITTARKNVFGDDYQMSFCWDDVKRIKDTLDIPLILKGIATAEDAAIALQHGVEGVYVSNHGGRQLDHGRGGIEVLPEVVAEVRGRAAVMVDGGFLRGTDVVKALILGADAVGIGRMFGYGIAAAGEEGVARVLELLENEIRTCLGLLGARALSDLDATYLHMASPVVAPHGTSAFPLLEEGY
jgi:isopentenyl diphosphate isomerase/L-lactate dehydrogenase-like FMN-dependent dehydrogenase